jgi:hypothetical protein
MNLCRIFLLTSSALYAKGSRLDFPDMKKESTMKPDQDIPELTREQLGVGVRGKHFQALYP